jgi:hypothetical protein
MKVMNDLKMKPIFCVPYSPDYNGIESYWFLLKQVYKKDLLHRSAEGSRLEISTMIHNATSQIEGEKIRSCANGGLKNILSD